MSAVGLAGVYKLLAIASALPLVSALAFLPATPLNASVEAPVAAAASTHHVFAVPETRLDASRAVSFRFTLPADAKQGNDEWFVFKFRARIAWSGEANATGGVSAATNGAVVSQVELESKQGARRVFYNGDVTGPRHIRPTADQTLIEYDNYLQFDGVVPGSNVLTLKLEPYEGSVVDEVVILEGSRLYRTSAHPRQLELGVPGRSVLVPTGEEFAVPVRLRHKGQRPQSPLVVQVKPNSDSVRPLDPDGVRVDQVGENTSANIRMKIIRPGNYIAIVSAVGDSDRANTVLRLTAHTPQPWYDAKVTLAVGLVAAAGLLGLLAHRVKRADAARQGPGSA